ncbi:MAG: hypothetical protein ABWX66_05285, partial [Lacisediminihabitans sp.]
MKRVAFLTTLLTAVLVVLLPFIGGGGPSIGAASAALPETGRPLFAAAIVQTDAGQRPSTDVAAAPTERSLASQQAATAKVLAVDTEHLAQKPVPIPPPPAPPAATGKRG